MNAREAENYLAISRSSSGSASKSVQIYRGRLFFRAESSLIQLSCRSLVNFRVETKILVGMSEEI